MSFANLAETGFIRNLTASEIVQQIMLLGHKINRIVFMGMGEPLFNYNELIKSIHILRDRNGLNFPTDGITVSTVGPIEQLKKLREEHIKIQLTLSLHATTQKIRDKIMPGMSKNRIDDIVKNVLDYSDRHNRTVVIAYLLLPGVNDKPSDVVQLRKWFANKKVMINLLQYNNTSATKITRPNKQVLTQFKRKLEEVGLKVKIRESHGQDVNAACGQLVSKYNAVSKKGNNEKVYKIRKK